MIEDKARNIRKTILKLSYSSGASHIASALSCADILAVLYFKIMQKNDKFILSKGHACNGLYAVVCPKKKGLWNHPTRNSCGIEASTGSLGHGFSIGIGMALANKKNKVFVLLSDGECDEGSVWEAALFAGHHKLNNLIVIIDYNKYQAFGETNKILNLEPFSKKWEAFGFSVKEVNGHDINDLIKSFEFKTKKPLVIIAHTIKGKGVSFMENKLEWHYKSLDDKLLNKAIKELE